MNCKLFLKDKTELSFKINGTNLVSKKKTPDDILTPDNLSAVKVMVDGMEQEYTDLILIQQVLFEGEYYLAFREKTEDEKREERMNLLEQENIELKQRCLETEAALIELAGMSV